MESGFDSVYADPETGVLRNRLGISDKAVLEETASTIAAANIDAVRNLCGRYAIRAKAWDTRLLRNLHKAIMGEIYAWAGEYRKVDIGIEYDHVAYEHWETMPDKLEEVFSYIRENGCFRKMSEGEQIKNLALVFGMIKNLQPFRDGNTRTAMVFTAMLARESGLVLDYSFLDRERFGQAQVLARDGNYDPLVMQFAMIAAPEKEMPSLKMPKVVVCDRNDDIRALLRFADRQKGKGLQR